MGQVGQIGVQKGQVVMRLLATIMFGGAIVAAAVVSGSSRTPSSPSVVSGFSRTQHAEMQRVPQFDNERATSWRSIIPPHTQSPLHRHDHFRALIALTGGDLRAVTENGDTSVTHLES